MRWSNSQLAWQKVRKVRKGKERGRKGEYIKLRRVLIVISYIDKGEIQAAWAIISVTVKN